MQLSEKGIKDVQAWTAAGYHLPAFDRTAMIRATRSEPCWIHFGNGNIFRAFQANVVQNLLERGVIDRGLIAAEGFDYEIIEKLNRPFDDLSILATLKADGTVEKTVIGSIAESLLLDPDRKDQFDRLRDIFRADSLQMASFTITEKGYSLTAADGELLADVENDFHAGPERPASYIGKVTSLLYERYLAGAKPIAMVSMDNCSHNGDRLQAAVHAFAEGWVQGGTAAPGFLSYVEDPHKVTFPWSMIDKITPRPDQSVEKMLAGDGVENIRPIVTSKNTFAAPFVNAEETEYLVIEDAFPNGRPPLEKGGVIFTDRETVDKVEKMKVCTCLNPLHTCLAIFGCLLGFTRISDEMKDPDLVDLIRGVGFREGLPVVVDPGILSPGEFLDTVLRVRFPNPFMPDTPQRIASDTSQKLAIRFGETIRAYLRSDTLDAGSLQLIPLVLAGWLRYLMAVDDSGKAFTPSPDPLLESCSAYVQDLTLAPGQDVETKISPLLHRADIFGVDLYEAGLAEKVISFFRELTAGKGAVRATLHRHVQDPLQGSPVL